MTYASPNRHPTHSATMPRTKIIVRFLIVALLGILLAGIQTNNPADKFFLECLITSCILMTFLCLPPVAQLCSRLKFPHAVFTLLLIWLSLYAQWRNDDLKTFPFVPWTMYSQITNQDTVSFYECVGIKNTGEIVFLNPGQIFIPLAQSRLKVMIETLADSQSLFLLEKTLSSMGSLYNKKNPRDPIKQIKLLHATINYRKPTKPRIQRSIFCQLDLHSGQFYASQ